MSRCAWRSVVDAEGQPVADAEVILVTPVDESISYKSYHMALVEGRVRNPLEHVLTLSDAKGAFSIYPPWHELLHHRTASGSWLHADSRDIAGE
ncbi:MAG: hypothetical protein R3B91_13145 [Planctomycetaceae bacterium]